jgi:hypothetical protein
MADPRAFLSFDFDHDSTSRTLFAGQAKSDSPTPFTLEDWSSKSVLPEKEWEDLMADKISNCHMMIVLVGMNRPGFPGDSKPWKGWSHARTELIIIEAVSP